MTVLGPFAHFPRPRILGDWLWLDLGARFQILGWPVVGPALGAARHIAWLQVRDADLPPDADPAQVFQDRARDGNVPAEIGLMTAADIARFVQISRRSPAGAVSAIVTAGLGNGESVLPRPSAAAVPNARPAGRIGTVNIVVLLSQPLSFAAALEALSIATQARTAAIMGLGLAMPDGRPVTGTGTDCLVIASPLATATASHCGLHTGIGRLLGETVHAATAQAGAAWQEARLSGH
jgi:adenosylcobinamide amidohydrolase